MLHIIPTTLLALLLTASPSQSQLTWEKLETDPSKPSPSPRRDAGLGWDGERERLVVYGGRGKQGQAELVLGDTWSYNFASKTWTQISQSFHPAARFSFVYGMSDGYFYVTTGQGPNNVYYDDIWRLDLSKDEWEELPAQTKPRYYTPQQWSIHARKSPKPAYRQGAVGGIFPGSSRVYLSLGVGETNRPDTFSYRTQGWVQEHSRSSEFDLSAPAPRSQHAGTMLSQDELLLFGGCLSGSGSGGSCPAADSWVFHGKTKTWTEVGGCASSRNYATLASLPIKNGERRAVLYGGEEMSPQVLATIQSGPEQVGIFNPDTMSWSLHAAGGEIPSKRASTSMATGEEGIYMFGGINTTNNEALHNDLYLLRGDASTADAAPKPADCKPTFFNMVVLHGVLMALGWGLFLQWGAFIARYMNKKNPLWIHLHRLFQIFGLLVALVGMIMGILSVRSHHFSFTHAILGLVVMILGVIQPISALIRPKEPEPETKKKIVRIIWEFIHSWLGRATLILALINISFGLLMANAHRIIFFLWLAYLCILAFSYFMAEACQRCRKDYRYMRKTQGFNLQNGFVNRYTQNKYVNKEPPKLSRNFSKYSFDNPAMQ